MPDADDRYWAFISYSHADEAWAQWLRKSLERYRIPARLVGTQAACGPVPARLYPVFRDRDELPGSSELGPELQRALAASRSQIVVCSPKAAQSRWVNEEIKHYKSLGRAHRVFALIVDGEPHAADPARECFPEALRHPVDAHGRVVHTQTVEPIAADARRHADGRANARLKLVSGILGVGFDELRQRELHARSQRLALLSMLAMTVAAVTLVLAVFAYQARNDALRRQQQAESLIQFMLGDLREKLEPIGKLAILDAVGREAMDYFATLDEKDQSDAALGSQARALRQIGEVRLQQGNLAGAAESFAQAERLNAELLQRHPRDTRLLHEIAEAEFAMGNAHYLKGELDEALVWIRRNAATVARLARLEPKNPQWLGLVADANSNLGAIAYQHGAFDQARTYFGAARDAQQQLVDQHPDNDEFVVLLAQYHGWLSAVEKVQQDWQAAAAQAGREAALLRGLTRRAPDNANHRAALLAALTRQLANQSRLAPLTPDTPILVEALALARDLAALDRDNIDYQRLFRAMLTYLQEAELRADAVDAATQTSRRTLAMAVELADRAPERADLWEDLLITYAGAIELAALREDAGELQRLLDAALDLQLPAQVEQAIGPAAWLELYLLGWTHAAEASERARCAAAAAEWLDRAQAGSRPPAPVLMLRYAALDGDAAGVRRWAAALDAGDRTSPRLAAFCARHGDCAAQLQAARRASGP